MTIDYPTPRPFFYQIFYQTQALLILISDAFFLSNLMFYNYRICMICYQVKTNKLLLKRQTKAPAISATSGT